MLKKLGEKPNKLILAAEANSWGRCHIFRWFSLQGKAGQSSGRHAQLQIKFVLSQRESTAKLSVMSLHLMLISMTFWVEHLFIQTDTTGLSSWRLAVETPPWLSHFSSARAQSSQDRVKWIKQTKRKQQENSSFVTFQSLLKLKLSIFSGYGASPFRVKREKSSSQHKLVIITDQELLNPTLGQIHRFKI